jgi:5-methylcytosine-specific restriction endonuclease McrA
MVMTADVLVLNSRYYAIQVADWKRVFSLVWQGHAEIVDENYQTYDFNDWAEVSRMMNDSPSGWVNTPTLRLAIPDVIRLTRYERLPESDVKFTRRNIYEHYDYTCSYCGEKKYSKDLNLDHVKPRSRGGKMNWKNIVLSCIDCNRRKADRTPDEAGMKLRVKPSQPRWKGVQHMTFKTPFKVRSSWQRFIDKAYWDSELDQS